MTGAPDPGLRRELAKAVRSARRIAEAGARAALVALGVGEVEACPSVSEEDRALRKRLQARAGQLGDRERGDTHETDRLAREVAYEHWHRMLFARFLAENGLLLEPDSGGAVSLDECRELARERGADAWGIAGGFAAAMLPRIFRPDDPSLALRLAPETQQALEKTLADLPAAVFRADDSLGWTYQFWQADRKDEVNRSGKKIGADELPAVTQLFTEPYMVRFLFHNTVGAWRAGRLLEERPGLATGAADESELRRAVRLGGLGGYDFDYLRFVRTPLEGESGDAATGPWRPAAGAFDRWPKRAAELKVLDPCCGSGHFLVEGLHLFARLRMEEESLPLEDAIRAVLRDNLHGLELDPRCTQIAAFAVAFAAWKLAGRVIDLPPLRIVCSGLAPNATKEEWRAAAESAASALGAGPRKDLFRTQDTLSSAALRRTFGALHDLFSQGPVLGSLIGAPTKSEAKRGGLFDGPFETVRALLDRVLEQKEADPARRERTVAAAGMAEAANLLQATYSLVITNVPYLARGRQDLSLRGFAEARFAASKGDLATMFAERGLDWLEKHGTEALVVPQNWLFLKTYRKLREDLLFRCRWGLVARLGPGAFEAVGGHVVQAAMVIVSADQPDADWDMAGLDVSAPRGQTPNPTDRKAELMRGGATVLLARQADQWRNPERAVLLRPFAERPLLERQVHAHQGIASADYASFGRKFWEFPGNGSDWAFQQTTVKSPVDFGGREHVLYWQEGEGTLQRSEGVRIQGGGIWNREAIAVSQMGPLPITRYTGELFDNNTSAGGPLDEQALPAAWCFCSSPEYARSVRELDQALKVTNATLVKVPFDLGLWTRIAAERYPHGLPEPYSDDPTQWIFHGHPCGSVVWDEEAKRLREGPLRTDATVLQIAVARLLGYRWPAERDPKMRLAAEQRTLADRSAGLVRFADADGIACLPAVRGERRATDRLRELLAAAYGASWSPDTEQRLLAATGDRKPPASLDEWLRDHFFREHCRLFHHRPFVWHLWDGRKDGFHALVNYHRLAGPEGEGRRTLEALTYSYLGDWIERQRAAQREEAPGADARLVAALELKDRLERILEGEPPLDLFVRWKPLQRQPLGWDPDLDDGVRLNLRPFLRAEIPRGRTGAGVLRWKPNVHWKKDRGREPRTLRARRKGDETPEIRPKRDFPWFWSCPGDGSEPQRTDFRGGAAFDGARWNDLHYTNATKRAARKRREGQESP